MEFQVKTSKIRIIVSSIVAGILFLVTAFSFNQFTDLSSKYGVLLYVLSLIASLIVGVLIALRFEFGRRLRNIVSVILFFSMPFFSIVMVEILNSVFVYDFTPLIFIGNYVFYLMFYGIFYAITGSYSITIYVFNSIVYLLALANNLVYSFRGTVFLPSDFLGIKTAVGVAGTYSYSITGLIAMATIIFVFIITMGTKVSSKRFSRIHKIVGRSVGATFFVVICCIYLFTDILANFGIKPDFWNQTRGYHKAGFFPNFCLNIKYLYYTKPSGYDADDVSNIVFSMINDPLSAIQEDSNSNSENPESSSSNTESETSSDSSSDTSIPQQHTSIDPAVDLNKNATILSERHKLAALLAGLKTEGDFAATNIPNIICIMNESLSDLSVLGEFETNIDYMPFMRSLTKNTIRGNLYVPVNGAGTSNSEFEFLTGCSTAFLPSGSNAYMSYIKQEIPSLVSTLGSCGYSKLAFHPYYASGWNRPTVYNLLGFERFRSLGSIVPMQYMNEYQASGGDPEVLISRINEAFPGQNILLRQYVSDVCNYNTIISEYERRDASRPFFVFNVTMQNHGGYTKECSNFNQEVHVTSSDKTYRKTNQYLSLVKKSDEAFEELINYFSSIDHPTIICMFGDHQPSIETEFIEEVMGKKINDLTNEELQKRYIAPFFIWANYDIEEEYIEKLSSNYLASYVLKVAGVEMTPYNQYLYSLSKILPVIDTVGYIDADNIHYTYNKSSKYSKIISDYEKVQYNLIFDNLNRKKNLFYLDEQDTSDYIDPKSIQSSSLAEVG